MKFRHLLTDLVSTDPAVQQRSAAQRFPEQITAHGMHLWRPGEEFKSVGTRFLLGVAAGYSIHDLDLLDEIADGINQGRLALVSLDIFDISQIIDMDEFEAYIPGIAPVRSSPILGVWLDGSLRERLQGYQAKQRLLDAFQQ